MGGWLFSRGLSWRSGIKVVDLDEPYTFSGSHERIFKLAESQ